MTAPRTVVLADDTDDLRALLRIALRNDNAFEVVGEAADGAAAVEAVARLRPHVIVLDLAMPRMDGLQAIPFIRQMSPDTRIVVLSGFDAASMAGEAKAAGADAYVNKGESVTRLSEVLRAVLGIEQRPFASQPFNEVSRAKDAIAITAHELRGPLAAVIGATTTLERAWPGLPEDDRLELVGVVRRQGQRLERMIENMLASARLDAGSLEVWPVEVDVEDLIAATLAAGEVDVASVDGAAGVIALADVDRLQQVLTNFLRNAGHYGSPPITIEVATTTETVEIRVRDAGSGVPADQQRTLFGRWSSFGQSTGGIGLGLYIARGLARAMRGDAWYEDGEPGAVFVVRVPRAV